MCIFLCMCVCAVSLTDIAVGWTADRGQHRKGGGGHVGEDEDRDDEEREGWIERE